MAIQLLAVNIMRAKTDFRDGDAVLMVGTPIFWIVPDCNILLFLL